MIRITKQRRLVIVAASVALASSSDVVENECQECPFAATTLGLWRTEELVTTADMRGEVDGREPDQTLQADANYSAALDPGYYVVCQTDEPCVAFQLRDGDLITINVKLRYGPPSFFVFDAKGKRQDEIFGFFALPAPV